MENFKHDPLQEKFNKKVLEVGPGSSPENTNKLLTAEEWFASYYQGEEGQAIPDRIIKDTKPEVLLELKEKYGPEKRPEVEQTKLTL